MAPFPESEDMTIKRLMVALRKNDYQLLKMGTYKLHEKFHTGHEFELTDELREILEFVEKKQYPPEISDILCSTIKDILSKKAMREISNENKILPDDSGKNSMPEALKENLVPDYGHTGGEDIKELAQMINSSSESAGSEESLRPIQVKLPEANQISLGNIHEERQMQRQERVLQNTYYKAENTQGGLSKAPHAEYNSQTPLQTGQPGTDAGTAPEPRFNEDNSVKNIAVFYDDFKNEVNYSEVKDYKNSLNLMFSKNSANASLQGADYNILKQISSLTQLLDCDVSDVDKIISMLTTSKGKVSFITASQSENISKTFCRKNIDFEIPFIKKAQDKNSAFDFIPMAGATNIFVCSKCNLRTLKTDFNTRTLSVQCPHCDGAAFPDLYALNSYNPDCHPVFWHRAFAALIKSQIWILVNPPLDENKEIIFDFIKTAYETNTPSKVYILSRENDKKEFYRQTFMSIDENCTIKFSFPNQDKLCEEFINEEIIKKVFA